MTLWTAERRIQRREFRDYQPLFMLVNSLDFIDDATRREFTCIQGPVWRRYNETTRRARDRRITVLFLSDDNNRFEELLFVGCDAIKGRDHRCRAIWTHPNWAVDDVVARWLCVGLAGRSVLRGSELWASDWTPPPVPVRSRAARADGMQPPLPARVSAAAQAARRPVALAG